MDIKKVYLTAATSESKNRLSMAYKQYIYCIQQSMSFLSQNSFQSGQQQNCQIYLAVVEKCSERIKVIYPKIAPKHSKTIIPQEFPNPQPRTPVPTTQSFQGGPNVLTQPPMKSVIPNHPQTGSVQGAVDSGLRSSTGGGDLRADLKRMMKEYENRGIGKMNEDSILKRQFSLQERTEREMNKQATKLRKSVRNSFYGGSRWKRDNQWSNFIQKNFHYVKMNNDMLLKDKSFIDMIGKTSTSVLFPHVNSMKQAFVAPQKPGSLGGMAGPPQYSLPTLPSIEEERKKKIAEEIEVFVEKYLLFDPPPPVASSTHSSSLVGIHQPRKHQLLLLIDRFIAYLRDSYFIPRKITKQDLNVTNLREDVRSFTDSIVGFLLGKLWKLKDELCQNILSEKLINGIYRVIFRYIQHFYITIDCRIVMKHKAIVYQSNPNDETMELFFQKFKKNETFNQKINGFAQYFGIVPFDQQRRMSQRRSDRPKFTLKHLRMKKKYRLERVEEPYLEVIRMFQEFSLQGFIVDKLELTQRCLKQVTTCVNSYYSKFHPEKKEHDYPPVGAEELLPIFVYCLIKSRSFDMMFKFYYIEAFLTDDLIRGILGYSLATLETSLSYIWERLTIEEMLESEKFMDEKERGGNGESPRSPMVVLKDPNENINVNNINRGRNVSQNVGQRVTAPKVTGQVSVSTRNVNVPGQGYGSQQIQGSRRSGSVGREYRIPESFSDENLDSLDDLSGLSGVSKGKQPLDGQKRNSNDEEFFKTMSSTLDGLLNFDNM